MTQAAAETVRVGRPPKREHERRVASTRADLTLLEKQFLRDQARAAGMTEAAYVRRRVLGLPITVPKPKTDVRLLYELNAIGVNLNQLARNVNSGRVGVHALDWDVVRAELHKVLSKVGAAFDE